MQNDQGRFQAVVTWWLRSKAAHMVSAAMAFAVPITVVFAAQLHARGALTAANVLVIFAIATLFGFLGAFLMWELWFKKRRL